METPSRETDGAKRIADFFMWVPGEPAWCSHDPFIESARAPKASRMPSLKTPIGRGRNMEKCEVRRLMLAFQLSRILGIALVSVVSAHGQRFEVTPLVGGILGGTWRLEQQGVPNFDAHLGSGLSFGITTAVRFDGDDWQDENYCKYCNSIAFRWVRQNTHLGITQDPVVPSPPTSSFHPGVTVDHFLSDFTHEWAVEESKKINP